MSDHKTFSDTSFADFMSMVRIHAQAAEDLYRRVIGSQDSQEAREELLNAIHDGANSFALASAKVLSDLGAIDRMADTDDSDREMWAAIAADVADGVTDLSTLDEFAPASEMERDAAKRERATYHQFYDHSDSDSANAGLFGDLLAGPGPQTDREDDTAETHDEWVRDRNSTTEDDK